MLSGSYLCPLPVQANAIAKEAQGAAARHLNMKFSSRRLTSRDKSYYVEFSIISLAVWPHVIFADDHLPTTSRWPSGAINVAQSSVQMEIAMAHTDRANLGVTARHASQSTQ